MSIEAMKAVWAHSETRGNARMVLTLIADQANDEGWDSYPYYKTLAKRANISPRTVEGCIAKAVELGELEVHRPDRTTSNRFSIMLPGLAIHDDPEERDRRDAEYAKLRFGRVAQTQLNRANRCSEDPAKQRGPRTEGLDEDPAKQRGGTPPNSGVGPRQTAGSLKEYPPINPPVPLLVPTSSETEQEDTSGRLCRFFGKLLAADGVKVNDPESEDWLRAARLMIDRDGRDVDEVVAVMRWTRQDDFWRANVLSMPKLRKQFDQLRLKAQADPSFKTSKVTKLPPADTRPLPPEDLAELRTAIEGHLGEDGFEAFMRQGPGFCRRADRLIVTSEHGADWIQMRYGRVLADVAAKRGFAGVEVIAATQPTTEEAAA